MGLLIIGLSIGLLLFLLAAGLTLVFGMLGVINLAHGGFYMLGAYLAWQVVASSGSFTLAAFAAVVGLALLGMLIERWLLRPLYHRPHEYQLLLTFGLVLVLEEAVRVVWGLDYKSIPVPAALNGWIEVAGSRIGIYRLFVCAVAGTVALALVLLLERTMLGSVVRAAAANPRMLSCMGVDVNKVRLWVFAFGAALGGLAGVLAAPMVPADSAMGVNIIIDCFVVIVVGGMGNIRGAVAAALLLGLARAVGQQFAPEWIDVLTYSLLIAVLLFRPQGLFGKKVRTA